MKNLKERITYLQGLSDGLQINDSSKEGKLLTEIISVLGDMASVVDEMKDEHEQLCEQVDTIDEDLGEIESIMFDGAAEDDEDEEFFAEVECPHCGEIIELDEDLIDEEGNAIECPHCNEKIEIEWECDCGCDDDCDCDDVCGCDDEDEDEDE